MNISEVRKVGGRYKLLIVGGGLAAVSALEVLAQEKAAENCAIISSEPHLPYDRPPLSKDYLLGRIPREEVFLKPESFYSENGIDVFLKKNVTALDTSARKVHTHDGVHVEFENLMIATGAELVILRIPGADLEGIFYLRVLGDSEAIRKAAGDSRSAMVIGAGFIGLEAACALQQMGLSVTVLEVAHTVFSALTTPELSDFYLNYFKEKGIAFVFGEKAEAFEGNGRLRAVRTSGGRKLRCDIAVVGVGVKPATDFLEGSGLELNNGIMVNEFMETNIPGIYAAGDAANYFDLIYKRRRRIEHWDNAIKQGQVVAQNVLGHRQPYRGVSYFFSDVWDLHWQLVGDFEGATQRIIRGAMEDRKFGILYLKDRFLQAMFLLGLPFKEIRIAEKLIVQKISLEDHLEKLKDPSFPLKDLLPS
ncbi:MAG: FAD-dependent oxidoreductase [Bacteroidota bacterium]